MHAKQLSFTVILLMLAGVTSAADDVAGHLMLINDNGAWSWFEDERAIVDPIGRQVVIGSIADASGTDGTARNGRVEVTSFSLDTRRVMRTTLSTLPADDHNTPGFVVRPDGRYLALYAGHGSDQLTRWRISANPGDPTTWQPEQTRNNGAGTTYNNVYRLASEGNTYNFTRTTGFDPNVLRSSDDGATWTNLGKLLQDPANSDSTRPYLRYTSNNTDKVHFISTEGHPRDVNNGIYHGYVQGSNVYRSDGTLVGALGSAPSVASFTTVFAPNSVVGGTTRTNAWTTDIALDASGNPVIAFTSRVAGDTSDHRFYYGRWSGTAWVVNELAKAGAGLYTPENDYTGLVALDPQDPSTLYISSRIDPRSDSATAHHEIYRGTTTTGGTNWNWTAITSNSSVDNLRPIMPSWTGGKALMWLRGTYTTYTDYDLAVVALVDSVTERVGQLAYHDATLANTVRADGQPFVPTGPSSSAGAADNNWHQRTGFGNGSTVLTASEGTAEDAPILKTTLAAGAGTFDVYALFWANPNEDWQVLAGLSQSEMRLFEQNFAEQAAAEDFDGAVTLTGSTVALYKAYLGRVQLSSPDDIAVFIDASTFSTGAATRTWYDGVALAPVEVPEPSAVTILFAASAWACFRRRSVH